MVTLVFSLIYLNGDHLFISNDSAFLLEEVIKFPLKISLA